MPLLRIYQWPDGSLYTLAPNAKRRLPDEPEAEFIARVLAEDEAKDVTLIFKPGWVRLADVDTATLPARRRFRAAWRWRGGACVEDVTECRKVRLAEIRADRNKRLAASDPDMMRARETGALMAETNLKDYRQKLRDLPATAQTDLDVVPTPDAVAAYEPVWPVKP